MAESSLRKLRLEIASLEWQNSRLGVLSKSTTLITIVITLATVIATLIGWGLDRAKEREIRTRELAERTENRYRSTVQQLIRYPLDQNQTTASVIFTLKDLSNILETGYSGDELTKRRLEAGSLLSELVKSNEFDLTKVRNVEFDYAALKYCSLYTETLLMEPKYTRVILERYARALKSFSGEDPIIKTVVKVPDAEDKYKSTIPTADFSQRLRPFVIMLRNYELHVGLLNRNIQESGGNADERKLEVIRATCDFYKSTVNVPLTLGVFKIDETELNARLVKCQD